MLKAIVLVLIEFQPNDLLTHLYDLTYIVKFYLKFMVNSSYTSIFFLTLTILLWIWWRVPYILFHFQMVFVCCDQWWMYFRLFFFSFFIFFESQTPGKKKQWGAKLEYKTIKKNIFTLENVEYNKLLCQLSHIRSNDEIAP